MSDQAVDIRAQFNKDVELLQQPLKVGDRVLSNSSTRADTSEVLVLETRLDSYDW